jgi:hypothetical protein
VRKKTPLRFLRGGVDWALFQPAGTGVGVAKYIVPPIAGPSEGLLP